MKSKLKKGFHAVIPGLETQLCPHLPHALLVICLGPSKQVTEQSHWIAANQACTWDYSSKTLTPVPSPMPGASACEAWWALEGFPFWNEEQVPPNCSPMHALNVCFLPTWPLPSPTWSKDPGHSWWYAWKQDIDDFPIKLPSYINQSK